MQTTSDLNSSENGVLIQPRIWEIWAVSDYRPFDEETFIPKLKLADEIWIKKVTAGYAHVALYIGHSEIIHVTEVEKSGFLPGKTLVRRDLLRDVAKSGTVVGYRTIATSLRQQEEAVQRARDDVGKRITYKLTEENCEHQVKYWITGVQNYRLGASTQMRDYVVIGLIFFLAGIVVGGCIFGLLWKNALAIIGATFGMGAVFVVVGVAIKFVLTSLQHR